SVSHLGEGWCRSGSSRSFFFFQAEDGIRDATVTGVQTCALPIFAWAWALQELQCGDCFVQEQASRSQAGIGSGGKTRWTSEITRSEERRVGKERTTPRGPDPKNKRRERADHENNHNPNSDREPKS